MWEFDKSLLFSKLSWSFQKQEGEFRTKERMKEVLEGVIEWWGLELSLGHVIGLQSA